MNHIEAILGIVKELKNAESLDEISRREQYGTKVKLDYTENSFNASEAKELQEWLAQYHHILSLIDRAKL